MFFNDRGAGVGGRTEKESPIAWFGPSSFMISFCPAAGIVGHTIRVLAENHNFDRVKRSISRPITQIVMLVVGPCVFRIEGLYADIYIKET